MKQRRTKADGRKISRLEPALIPQVRRRTHAGRGGFGRAHSVREAGAGDLFTYHDAAFYYDALSPRAAALELWETTYIHILDCRPALVEWIKATGLRPYLERLREEDERRAFESDFLQELEDDYPLRPDGKVLFPFKRLFFIAYTRKSG